MGDFSPVSYKACVVWGKGLNTTASRTRLFVSKFKRYTCIQAARNTKTLYTRSGYSYLCFTTQEKPSYMYSDEIIKAGWKTIA